MPRRSTTEQFVEKAKQIHNNKYDYSKVDYINNHTKVCIICPIHSEFWQTPNNHLTGQGCPACSSENLKKKRLEQPHFDRNSYLKERKRRKVEVECPICHEKRIITWGRRSSALKKENGLICESCSRKFSVKNILKILKMKKNLTNIFKNPALQMKLNLKK